MQFHIKHLAPGDALLLQQLTLLFANVFETGTPASSITYLQNLLERPGFVVYVTLCDGEVVAGLTAYELPMYSAGVSEMFIYDIAVLPAYQRKGLGKMLLSALKDHCRQRGIKEMFVPAHETDTHALDFYRSAGGVGERVVHFNFMTGQI